MARLPTETIERIKQGVSLLDTTQSVQFKALMNSLTLCSLALLMVHADPK